MNIMHYTVSNYENGSLGGVARFDHELKKVFPEMVSHLNNHMPSYRMNFKNTIVITDHSFITEIPPQVKVIAVHHGMAAEHILRNPEWQGAMYVRQQKMMSKRKGKTWFVGISKFTQEAAKVHHNIEDDAVILHAVDTVPITKAKQGYNVIGDWRTPSKGRDLIQKLREECPEFTFNHLQLWQIR